MILYKRITNNFIKDHGRVYCIACKKRGMRVPAEFIPSYPENINIKKEFASCEFHIDESELFLIRRMDKRGKVSSFNSNVELLFKKQKLNKRKQNEQKRTHSSNRRKQRS